MVIADPVTNEEPLVGARGHHGGVADADLRRGDARRGEGVLDAHRPRLGLVGRPQDGDAAPEVEKGVGDPVIAEDALELVGGEALGNATEVDGRAGVEGDPSPSLVNAHVLPAHGLTGAHDLLGRGHAPLADAGLPEGGERSHGHVEGAVGDRAHLARPGEDAGHILWNGGQTRSRGRIEPAHGRGGVEDAHLAVNGHGAVAHRGENLARLVGMAGHADETVRSERGEPHARPGRHRYAFACAIAFATASMMPSEECVAPDTALTLVLCASMISETTVENARL